MNEREKAENYINAVIDNYKQDIKGTLYQKLNQEDVKDFLVNFYIDVTSKLEKENAELKAELSENKVADCHIVNGLCEQLTKAKEIIKKMIEAIHIWDCKNLEEVEAEAEQFLSSEVEK